MKKLQILFHLPSKVIDCSLNLSLNLLNHPRNVFNEILQYLQSFFYYFVIFVRHGPIAHLFSWVYYSICAGFHALEGGFQAVLADAATAVAILRQTANTNLLFGLSLTYSCEFFIFALTIDATLAVSV